MILEVTGEQIAQLNDADLRTLVGYLCEQEVRERGYSPSAVTWGGHQNASDGGVDVRVAIPAGAEISGYVPKAATVFQVKAQNMPRAAILSEMAPDGAVLLTIAELAKKGGAYIIVSSQGSVSDTSLTNRKFAMSDAVKTVPFSSALTLDFYDRRRVATWVNQYPGLIPWIRERLGLPLSGWRPFEDWSSAPGPVDTPYLQDGHTRLVGPSIQDGSGVNAEQALVLLRGILAKPKGAVRLVGLSGVGKTRLIQALFDDRIGTNALARADALYTEISDQPDPVPQEMLRRLVNMKHRAVLIVDNCGIELHKQLAATIAASNCRLSVITVEYDITDDEPQNTEVFKLEPASPGLIEKMLETRYPAIAPPSRSVIVKFSEGNSRVAFALAETAKHGESLAKLKDTDLFERLFYQQKAQSADLLDAAKACALMYSFDGETLDGLESELLPLAGLVSQSVDQLYKHIAELQRRHLVQKRGKWRAILPHALANRLAKRALEDVPLSKIESGFVSGASARMLRSFSRRIGYLHDDANAVAISARWCSADGLLKELGKLNTLEIDVFGNIASANPGAALAFIEDAATRNEEWFFGKQNRNKSKIVQVVRSLAYDPNLFERSAVVLQRFVLCEAPRARDSTADPLKSLFSLYLSGTRASSVQRANFVKMLIGSRVVAEQELGLELLGQMLQTSNFTSHHSFEFGAWKRDYGLYPKTRDDIRAWYAPVLELCCVTAASGIGPSDRVRLLVANHIAPLLWIGMFDEVVTLANSLAEKRGWPEGWIGIRKALRQGKEKIPDVALKKLEVVERRLRPSELAELIRTYALSPEWSAVDVADLDDEAQFNPLNARERVHEICIDLGQQLVLDSEQFDSMISEIIRAESQKTFALGQGMAKGCNSLVTCWDRLRDGFLEIPETQRQAQLLAGFFTSAMVRSPPSTEAILNEILSNSRLHPYLLHWQSSAGIYGGAFERMMTALTLTTVPVSTFHRLANGRAHEGLDNEQLSQILSRITSRSGGNQVATQVLGMRVFGLRTDKLPLSASLGALSREFLANIEVESGSHLGYLIGEIVEAAFVSREFEGQARAFCHRILSAIQGWKVNAWEIEEILRALTKTCPLEFLDVFVEQGIREDGAGSTFFHELRSERACPLEHIADVTWMAWAAEKSEIRYELLARVMRFSDAGDEEHAKCWSPVAIRLIETAPDPVKVLNTFLQRFSPSGWTGSFAETLATRMPLIEDLKRSPRAEIAAWANYQAPAFALYVDSHRSRELADYKLRDQTFE